jgi:hypothetical protein
VIKREWAGEEVVLIWRNDRIMTKGGHRVVACRWRRAAVAVEEAVLAFVMAEAVVVEAARIHCRYAGWCVERCADSKKNSIGVKPVVGKIGRWRWG